MEQAGRKSALRILVVDDDKDIVQTIRGNLELDGFDVLTAFDGRTGLETIKKMRPDLILLDLNLPDMDGIKACQVMRRMCDLPIIILTAREGVTDRVLGLECGADDYVIKPFNFLELSARIRAVLRRFEGAAARPQDSMKGLSIDFKSRKLLVLGSEVQLTKTEFELLELFVSHAGEVLSRDFIMNQIWRDSQLYQNSRAVDVHVQRLRKKIEQDLDNPQFIVTIPGVGYRFQDAAR